MPTIETQPEFLTFASVGALHAVPTGTPGWKGLDYTPLYGMGNRVGENRPIPGVAGRFAVAREIDEMRFPLHMRFNGRKDREGGTYSDRFEGVAANLLYFRKHVLDYVPERAVTFTMRSGSTATGAATIEDWEATVDQRSGGESILVVVRMTIAAGVLVVPA